MARSRKLVKEHLENVHWSVLKDYHKVVNDFIRDQAGVYALYKGRSLYYVGLATNLQRRLNTHLRDRHQNGWDRFSVYLTTRDEHIKELESLLLRIMSPKGNIQGGRFQYSTNLNPVMNRRIREFDAERRKGLIPAGRSRRDDEARRTGGVEAKEGSPNSLVGYRMTLRAWYKGWQYRAILRPSGKISYNGKQYETLSAAARAITGIRRNGWRF